MNCFTKSIRSFSYSLVILCLADHFDNIYFDNLAVLLGLISICTAIGAWHWLTDPNTSAVSFTQSLCNHPFFTMASIILGKYRNYVCAYFT